MIKQQSFIALLMALIHLPALASDDHEQARRLQQAGDILPLETIIQKAQSIQAGRLLEVELESQHGRYVYEIEILDERGRVWEVKIDARTAQLIEQEIDH